MKLLTKAQFKDELKKLISARGEQLQTEEDGYDELFAIRYGMLDACDEAEVLLGEISQDIKDALKL